VRKIILFDGVCNLCNHSVQFIIKHDQHALFSFASLQSEAAAHLLGEFNLSSNQLDSVVYIDGNKLYTESTAALKIANHLKAPWKFASIFIIIPKPLRNFFYKIIAKNRYKWFGKQSECMIPTPDMKKRFID
jgi:predicted DCC family thiol-disulfide oxidoreductase YuxK